MEGHSSLAPFAAVRELGRGRQGTVWLVRAPGLDGLYALKRFDGADPLRAAQAQQEFNVGADIPHPHLVEVLDHGRLLGGQPFVLYAAYEGAVTAAEWGVLPPAQLARLAWELSAALTAMHARGWLHRDVSPDNVLRDATGAARLMDLGLAARWPVPPEAAAGTPRYAAPETLRGEPSGPAADFWALGCLLYRLAVGADLFAAQTPDELLRAQAALSSAQVARQLAELPEALAALIRRWLSHEPGQRLEGLRELRERLLPLCPEPPCVLSDGLFVASPDWRRWWARRQRRGVVCWSGERGSGRSRCLRECHVSLRREGLPALLLRGAAHQSPYSLLETLWRWSVAHVPHLPESFPTPLARLVASLWPWAFPEMVPLEDPVRLARALPELLGRMLSAVAEQRLLTLLVDDWELVDARSREVIAGAWTSSLGRMQWIVAASHPLPEAENLALTAFDERQARAWLGSMLGTNEPPEWADALRDLTGGRPAWLRQAVWQMLRPQAGVAPRLPASVDGLFRDAWRELSQAQQELMVLLAVHGGRCPHEEWLAGTRLLPAAWPLDWQRLWARRLLEDRGSEVGFVVGWWRDWIEHWLGEAEYARRSGELAKVLLAAADGERRASLAFVHRLASLLARADDPQATLTWSARAAEAAARVWAYDAVILHAERGLSALAGLASEVAGSDLAQSLRIRLGDARRVQGDCPRAIASYEAALRHPLDALTRGRVLTSLGKSRQLRQELGQAAEHYQAAIAILGETTAPEEYLRALSALARTRFMAGQRRISEGLYRDLLRQAQHLGQPSFEAEALSFLGSLAVEEPATVSGGFRDLQAALVIRERGDDPFARVDSLNLLGNACLGLGRFNEARDHFERNRLVASEVGYRSEEGLAWLNLALCDLAQGRLQTADGALERAGKIARDDHYDFLAAFVSRAASLLAAQVGDWGRMDRCLARAHELETSLNSPYVRQFGLVMEAERHLWLGDFEAARRAAGLALAQIETAGGREWQREARVVWIEATLHAGDLARARAGLSELQADLGDPLNSLERVQFQRLSGWLALAEGDRSRAEACWHEALAGADEAGLLRLQLELAVTLDAGAGEPRGGLRVVPDEQAGPIWQALAARVWGASLAEREGAWQRLQGVLVDLTPTGRQRFLAHPLRAALARDQASATPSWRARHLEILLELATALGTARDPDGVLERVQRYSLELTRAERCLLLLLDAGTADWRVWRGAADLPYSHSIVSRVLASRVSECLVDTGQVGVWQPGASVEALALRSVMCVPIVVGTTLHGVIYVDSRAGLSDFDGEDVRMLEAIAGQAAVALDTARLLAALRRQMDQQTAHLRLLAEKDTALSALQAYDRARQAAFEAESHDLRAPLGSVLAGVQGLLRGLVGPLNDAQQEALEGVLQSTRTLMTRIDGILDAASLEAGKLSLRCEPVPLAGLLQGLLRAMAPLAEAKGLGLHAEVASWQTLPPAWGDARRLNQVFQNLLDNALKYTLEGEVKVDIYTEREGLRVCIRDTGPGLPAERRSAPFEKYGPRDAHQHGSGLGLWRTAALVAEHSGRIELLSCPEGGTEARVWLPGAPAATGEYVSSV
ncbi:MAG: ATP-binding protein [Candidatus Sericytochromatia bacterium]|nr:ATP-binding protein [Candidatus Sericytochromatia bacterium]